MRSYGPDKIHNVGLFGHGGSGKTTLAEALLLTAKAISRAGRVEDGNTVSDYDPAEQQRRQSINLSVAPLEWKDNKINLIDVPGTADFAAEVAAAMRVIANAKHTANTISGSTAPSAAAATGLVGMMPTSHSCSGATGGSASRIASAPARNAAAALPGTGNAARIAGTSNAVATTAASRNSANSSIVRAASRPALAALAAVAMPVTSTENTSGITVMRSAFTHRVPTGCSMATTRASPAWPVAAIVAPAARPTASARMMRFVGDMR